MDNARGTPYEAETGEAQERLDAYRAYVALLEKLLDKLRYHRDTSGKTPIQLALVKDIPNGGRHWTDWLPEEIKRRFHIAFDGLGEVRPLVLFPDTVFTVSTKPRKVCHGDTLKPKGTVIEQIRDKLRAADKAAMLDPTPENLTLRDTLILEREEAIRDKNRANVSKTSLVKKFMESDVLAQAFVLEAICQYAVQQLDAKDWDGLPIINQGAWRQIAHDALKVIGD
jgi:hypothetical protein